MLKTLLCATALLLPITSALAKDMSAFVEANVLGIVYHELGHAIIHTEEVPIFGQEEDAADVFSIFLVDALFEDDAARSLALDMAAGFEGEAMIRDAEAGEILWWDTHGPDEQRFYNMACILYGADPENRESFAEDVGLPQERAESCAGEYDQAAASWGAVMDTMSEIAGRPALTFAGDMALPVSEIIAAEVRSLNRELRLSRPVTVAVEECDDPNAYYDPEAFRIVFCTEFVAHLERIEALLK